MNMVEMFLRKELLLSESTRNKRVAIVIDITKLQDRFTHKHGRNSGKTFDMLVDAIQSAEIYHHELSYIVTPNLSDTHWIIPMFENIARGLEYSIRKVSRYTVILDDKLRFTFTHSKSIALCTAGDILIYKDFREPEPKKFFKPEKGVSANIRLTSSGDFFDNRTEDDL